jgi:hypothetical protein
MGSGEDGYIDHGKYQSSLEDLSYRNRHILAWFSFGIIWLFCNIFIFNVLWFWEEFYFAISEAGWQVVTENSDGSQCVVTEYESCERLVGAGGVWWSLLGSLLTGIAVGPLVFSVLILSYRNKDVTKKWKDEIWGLLFLINPSIIWALLFLICLPYAWTLLPWGEWSTNWWKIFPYGFGLIWVGGLPPILVIAKFFKKFFNQEYNYDLTVEAEKAEDDENHRIQEVLEKEHSSSTSESIEIIGRVAPNQPVRFRINRTRWGRDAWVGIYPAGAPDQDHGEQNKRWKWLREIDVNDATLPGQPAGKWSIRVFKDGGYSLKHRLDFEIHGAPQQPSTSTSSEGIVEGKVAFKSVHGKYLSAQPDGRTEWNRDRADVWEYFHLEKREGGKIALKGAHGMYVSAQPDGSVQVNRGAAPPGGWEEFTVEHQFIQPVGREGYDVVRLKSVHGKYLSAQSDGSAEWNRDQAPEGGWEDIELEYQDKKKHVNAERLHQSQACEIHILEATEGKPLRFNVNNRPSDNESWFGLYPEQATDHEHGDWHQNWMYFRDVGQNELSLPAKSAGRWSIRVFSDGGYNQIGRLDFDITEVHDSTSLDQPHHARRGNSEISDEEAIRLYKKALDDHGVPSDFLAETQTSRGQPASNSAKKIQSAVKESSGEEKTNFWD